MNNVKKIIIFILLALICYLLLVTCIYAFNPNTLTISCTPDTTPPADISDLSASTGTSGGTIDLTWTASGDDGNTGDITNGQYHIKYSSETAHTWDDMPYELQWSTNTSPGNNENKTINSLISGTTYYFYIKTADGALNWSGISNKPNASAQISSISISLDSSAYDFGTVPKNSTNVSVSSITVTNDGNVNERYSLQLAAPTGWTTVTDTAPGAEEFRMCGNFQTATAQTSHFDIGGSFSDAGKGLKDIMCHPVKTDIYGSDLNHQPVRV
jgi:hypothetical protein